MYPWKLSIFKPRMISSINKSLIDYRLVEYMRRFIERICLIMDCRKSVELDSVVENTQDLLKRYLVNDIGREDLVSKIIDYIGLGKGLTPSYDDYAVGLLSCYNLLARLYGLEKLLLPIDIVCRKTNWISCKIIEYSINNDIVEPLDNLLYSTFNSLWSEALDSLVELVAIGWNSGYYIARGVVDTLKTYFIEGGGRS